LAEDAGLEMRIDSEIKPFGWCAEAFRKRSLAGAKVIA
jgi:hypothetical protein